jgi:hypothetical protein
MEPEFTSHSCLPVSMNQNDSGLIYTFEIHQKGIINSEDIRIILDYEKDYPTRLFQRLEIYYDKEIIASNLFPEYLIYTKCKKIYSIKDLFPNYSFILDTTNKSLKFKFSRNPIKAVVNDIKITYNLQRNKSMTSLNHFTTIVSPLISNRFTVFIEHKPVCVVSSLVAGHNPDNPIQEIKYEIIKHFLNDAETSDPAIQEGLNVYFIEIENKPDNQSLNNVIYYVYDK